MTVLSFRPEAENYYLLEKIDNKSKFLNKLIEAYRISKLKADMRKGFSDKDNYDSDWINFDNDDYYNLIEKQGI